MNFKSLYLGSQNDIDVQLKKAWTTENKIPKSTIEHYIVQWWLENYSNYPNQKHRYITSPSFYLDSSKTTWCITFHLSTVLNVTKPSLYLRRLKKDEGPSSVAVTYRFGISNSDEKTTWFNERKINKFEKGSAGGIRIPSVEEELDIMLEEIPSQNDTFIFNCEIYVSCEIKKETNYLTTADYDLINLSYDFAKLMRTKKFSDYCIKIPHYDITTHKAVIAARSPVFQKLLRENESTSYITLEDESYSNITSLLLFMYTGNFNLVARNGPPDIGFYECARKFAVSELESLLAPNYLYVRSRIEIEELDVEWHIKDFSKKTQNDVNYITSPPFMTCHGNMEWVLTLQTRNSTDIQCSLEIVAVASNDTRASHSIMKVSLIDKYGSLQKTITATQSSEPKVEFLFLDYPSDLSIYNKKHNFLQGDTLKIHCKLTDVASRKINRSRVLFRQSTFTKVLSCLNLSDDLRKFFMLDKFTDVMIKTNTSYISAHSSILFARSQYLASKYSNRTPEDILDMSDFDHDIVSAMIDHAYSGSLKQMPMEDLAKLFSASEKYHFPNLSLVCAQLLEQNLNIKNFCAVLDSVVKHETFQLSMICLDFAQRNSKEIQESEEWKKLRIQQPAACDFLSEWLLKTSGGK